MLPVLLALAFIAIFLFVLIAGQPDEFIVSRSTTMAASPDRIFPHVNELKKWDAWSPWAKLDPNAKNAFEGPDAGVGSAMSWAGNKKIGEGKMTITESVPAGLIRLRLEFLKPFKATNTAEFRFMVDGKQTLVTWSMSGKSNFFFKIFGLFMDCDSMAGRDFEKGLAGLRSVAESSAK